jgi:hypothetical protein
MSNSLDAAKRTLWSREMQEYYFTEVIIRGQANFRLESQLTEGDRIKRISGNNGVPYDVADKYASVTYGDIKNSAEELVVDTITTVPFKISELDEIQMYVGKRDYYTKKFMESLRLSVNGRYLAEVTNAAQVIDAADFGGAAGDGAPVTPANVVKLFSRAFMKLGRGNTLKPGSMFANITPDIFQALQEATGYKESAFGDAVSKDGALKEYMGFDLFVHNAGYWTGTLKLATNPTAGDYIRIQVGTTTLTFNFVSSIGSTPGNVLIGGSNDATGANLAALLNAPTTTTANGVGFTAGSDEHFALYGATATYTSGTDLLTITWRGVGAPITTSSLTAVADGWQTGKNISHCMFGNKGAVDFVMQKQIQLDIDKDPDAIKVFNIKPFTMYGKKTFSDGAKNLINAKVDTTTYR